MIPNPPHIIELLRAWRRIESAPQTTAGEHAAALAAAIIRHLGHMPWDRFLAARHLYLQSIPMETAKAAWGVNAAAASLASTLHHPPAP